MTTYVGDIVTPVLTLAAGAFGADTAATLVVTDPDGTAGSTVTTTASGAGQTHTADDTVTFTAAGEWIYKWTLTNTGAGVEYESVLVAPEPTMAELGRVYATTEDYAKWLRAAPPAGARRNLAAASRRVDELLETSLYEVDDDDYPSDADQRNAVRWATCAQADYMRAIGDPYGRGAVGLLSSVSIGSVSVGRSAGTGGQGTRPPKYSEEAISLLRQAQFTNYGPITGW